MIFLLCQDIDDYLCQAKDKSYDTLMHFGRKGLNVAATAAVMAATKVVLTLNIWFVLTWGYSRVVWCFSAFYIVENVECCFYSLWSMSGRIQCLVCWHFSPSQTKNVIYLLYFFGMCFPLTLILNWMLGISHSRARESCLIDWEVSACRICLPTSLTWQTATLPPLSLQRRSTGPEPWCAASQRATARVRLLYRHT